MVKNVRSGDRILPLVSNVTELLYLLGLISPVLKMGMIMIAIHESLKVMSGTTKRATNLRYSC